LNFFSGNVHTLNIKYQNVNLNEQNKKYQSLNLESQVIVEIFWFFKAHVIIEIKNKAINIIHGFFLK
jgi:hypothetical protein